jgi:hypothetical protein
MSLLSVVPDADRLPDDVAPVPDAAWKVTRRAHRAGTAWRVTETGALLDTGVPLLDAPDPDVHAVPDRAIRALLIPVGDQWAMDHAARLADQHGATIVGRRAGDRWVGMIFHPAWSMALRVVRDLRALEEDEVTAGRRSPAQTILVDAAAPVPALLPDGDGRFEVLRVGAFAVAEIVTVSATAAVALTGRPLVRHGQAWQPTVGRRRASREWRAVIAGLVDDDPVAAQRPWMLRRSVNGRAEAVLLSRAIGRNPSKFLIERGVPSIHAWRACYLPVDGDSELAVEAALDVATARDAVLLGAYSGSRDPATGFRNLCLVMVVDPAEREAVADEIHDRMYALARERGLPVPDLHVARPREMSRLPCAPSVKAGAEVGYAMVRPVAQPRTGPTQVVPVEVDEAARLLRIDDARTVSAAPAATDRVRLAPTHRPVGVEAAWWVAGMGTSVRWHLTASLADLGQRYRHKDGTASASEAAWKVISSMRARGAEVADIVEVLAAGGAVADWLADIGSPGAQERQIRREVQRYDDKRTTHGPGRHDALAEACWQALPAETGWAQVGALAVLLDLVARVGRVDENTGVIKVDLGVRRLAEEGGAAWATLRKAAEQVPWLTLAEDGAGGYDDETGERRQATWVVTPHMVDVPEIPRRAPLRQYVDLAIRSRLVHAKGIPGQALTIVLAVRERPHTRAELRDRFSLTPQRLAQVMRLSLEHGLLVVDGDVVTAGPVSAPAVAVTLGAVDRYDDVVERHLGQRADDDERIRIDRMEDAGERRRAHAARLRTRAALKRADAAMASWDAERAARPEEHVLPPADIAELDVAPQVLHAQERVIVPLRPASVIRPLSDPDAVSDDGDGVFDPLAVWDGEDAWEDAA